MPMRINEGSLGKTAFEKACRGRLGDFVHLRPTSPAIAYQDAFIENEPDFVHQADEKPEEVFSRQRAFEKWRQLLDEVP
jgi:hypothetical protein